MKSLFRKILGTDRYQESARTRLKFDHANFAAIYAIGDVHGCIAQLKSAYDAIYEDSGTISGRKLIVLLGDYVDRGPESSAVLDFVLASPRRGFEQVLLCGNHDAHFLKFIQDPKANMGWLSFGGVETLLSYGIHAEHLMKGRGGLHALERSVREAIPTSHAALLASLPVMLQVGNIVFVHAGLRPGVPLSNQTDEDLMWIREPFLQEGVKLPYLVVHGHTVSLEPTFGSYRIGIDTGAFATGRLTVLRLRNGKACILGQQTNASFRTPRQCG